MTAHSLLPNLKGCEPRTPWDTRPLSGYRHLPQAISRRFKGEATAGKRERQAGRYRQEQNAVVTNSLVRSPECIFPSSSVASHFVTVNSSSERCARPGLSPDKSEDWRSFRSQRATLLGRLCAISLVLPMQYQRVAAVLLTN